MIKKLSIIIPCYNEEDTILQVVDKIKHVPLNLEKEIIIVCDGSSDGTKELLQKHFPLQDKNIKTVFHEKNMGKGKAVKTGIEVATGDYLIVQDADLELNPDDYIALLQPIQSGNATVVFGSRKAKGFKKLYFHSVFANFVVTFLTNFLYGSKLTDQACGYKILPVSLFKSLDLESFGFEFCSELTAKILRTKKYIISEVDVDYFPRTYKQGKKISWKDGFIAIWTLLKYKITK
ncbi:MAG: hypothetical protein A2539_04585 [Elusimicrobia bacterium RIFOXYD2_FULL_34_15]|nr:MAG: hypothetical protein A2539_04585 [Elusimicrobia bacterium RIFOXYD2_FULL_34_15]